MPEEEMTEIITLLAEANPKTIFLELAFVESWTAAVKKREGAVPVAMLDRSLGFFEKEFRWVPRPSIAPSQRLAWAGRVATLAALVLAGRAFA
ncbi:MAG: hypothetical protein JWM80_6079 [Cyanobacteria bacterium RYN_339]|nr:hypothetical protein [Cyanobacteria bacterium RYN_339]